MKAQITQLKSLAAFTREKMARAALVPAVMLMSSPVYAALPTMPTPGTGIGGATPADGDWLNTMGAWFKAGITDLPPVDVPIRSGSPGSRLLDGYVG